MQILNEKQKYLYIPMTILNVLTLYVAVLAFPLCPKLKQPPCALICYLSVNNFATFFIVYYKT
jgi:hypothetical protein